MYYQNQQIGLNRLGLQDTGTKKVREDWQLPRELENFLACGSPPECVTFGSIIDNEKDRITRLIKKALENEGKK